eukprot:CAMPEP_0185574380 /NCGR_PEP_ID=MMETSP0434-20130131/5861_1 /TAXON_ID=626734 ORGANISM="Favella taraikaensis, Strain Fe Narragansett Bay" /NCGR_SAMPLE_ID=MMETSP0434 /ASSEMBLY_ACC=CAM_ASM_000379 /LENGTH=38 /DNA_ID= /DNA_START= /DNA_END= /DNA_ORIENTATION=
MTQISVIALEDNLAVGPVTEIRPGHAESLVFEWADSGQ